MTAQRRLVLLAVDDEPPALDELAYLLRADPRVGEVRTASDAVTALRELEGRRVDGVVSDIRMPGLSGLDLARVLARFATPPPVVFVTAYGDAAVDAFALRAVDYLLKPVRADRLTEAVDRLCAAVLEGGDDQPATAVAANRRADDETVAVELGGVTRFVPLTDIRYVEAQGDYVRLHTASGSHLVRVPMQVLEERWAAAGFVRVHRSYLISSTHLTELRVDSGGSHAVRLGTGPTAVTLPVSRRHARALKDRLVRRARHEQPGAPR
jgi:two-component system response regulator LytT